MRIGYYDSYAPFKSGLAPIVRALRVSGTTIVDFDDIPEEINDLSAFFANFYPGDQRRYDLLGRLISKNPRTLFFVLDAFGAHKQSLDKMLGRENRYFILPDPVSKGRAVDLFNSPS